MAWILLRWPAAMCGASCVAPEVQRAVCSLPHCQALRSLPRRVSSKLTAAARLRAGSPVCLRSARCAGRSRTGCLRDRADGPPGPNRKCWRSVPAHARPASPQAPVRRGRCAAHSCRKAPYSAALAESAASLPSKASNRSSASRALLRSAAGRASIAWRSGPAMPGASNIALSLAANGVTGRTAWRWCCGCHACPAQPAPPVARSAPGRTGAGQLHAIAARHTALVGGAQPARTGPGRRDAASGRHSHPSRSDRPSPATAPAPAPRDGWGSARSPASQCPAGRRTPD